MKDWYKVRDSRESKPPEIETGASDTTVYERRNIKQETWQDEMSDTEVKEWVYEQREYTKDEYAALTAPATKAIMQAISDVELSVAMIGV